jgi:hypothetical protein
MARALVATALFGSFKLTSSIGMESSRSAAKPIKYLFIIKADEAKLSFS